jgi:CRP/FNR family transcriptional regulator
VILITKKYFIIETGSEEGTEMENIRIEFLRNIQLFASLTEKELTEVSSKINMKEFSRNEVILHEEDTNEFMYIILVGKVKAVQTTEEGKEIILAIHQADEFFGEISLIDGKTSSATVIAIEDSLVAIISKKNFYSLLLSQRKVLESLLQILCVRLREAWKRIHILNFRDAQQRIRMLFVILSSDSGERTPEGVVLNVKLTHQEIADMAGLTRETVTRELNKLRKKGEIGVQKKIIRLNPKFFAALQSR